MNQFSRILSLVILCRVLLQFHGTITAADTNQALNFNRDVRPILSKHCFACHGPDEQSRQGGFRLDVRDSAVTKVDSGKPPNVPGDLNSSELIRRIQSAEDSERMPPQPHEPLTSAEKMTLRRWIQAGAKYQRHWSFVPPIRPTTPAVTQTAWPRNAIDEFILARLESEGLMPSADVDRATLLRRVTLDLTGLPPTPDEIDAFLRDTRAQAYERNVDRLMNTTAYAERRAQDWLDLARYADTRGFADDKMRQIWPWRDWVIQAIDDNMPFDQFTIQQLAGDMLADATDQQRLATAFHRNAPQAKGMTYPVEEYRLKGIVDRVNTTGRVWLGLTLDCAECHDHKFDPVSQRDYYSLFAIFNNIEHSGIGFDQGGPTMDYTLQTPESSSQGISDRARLEAELFAARNRLPLLSPVDETNLLGTWDSHAVVADASKFSVTGDLTITAKIRTTQPVADMVSKYDWRGQQRSYVFGIGGEGDTNGVSGHLFCWVSSRTDPYNGAEIHGSFRVNDGREHDVAVEFKAGRTLRLFVDGVQDKAARLIGKVPRSIARSDRRLAIGSGYNGTPAPDAHQFTGNLNDVRLYSAAVGDQISLDGDATDEITRLRSALRELDERTPGKLKTVSAVPVMRERSEPRNTFIHVRGNFLDHGAQVFPAVPIMFDIADGEQPRNRLEFAKWLVNGRNPLVARVVVNRFWQSYFVRGLVSTPDDFGARGAVPTHPELLDWMACEFVARGWNMKQMHKLIVTSATYRQSSRITPQLRQRDPQNRLLGHMPRVRLPAEQIRDQALAVSGLLVRKVGGLPVFPQQPGGYWQQRALPGEWKNSSGDGRYRRTIYTYWRRMALHPSLEVLNAPARETCVARRDISNVPTQALVLLNGPVFHEAAGALAARLLHDTDGDDDAMLDRAFRLVLGRMPQDAERGRFLTYVARQRKNLSSDPVANTALSGLPESSDINDRTVWTLACSVLLNIDETMTRP